MGYLRQANRLEPAGKCSAFSDSPLQRQFERQVCHHAEIRNMQGDDTGSSKNLRRPNVEKIMKITASNPLPFRRQGPCFQSLLVE
jgi:hypothetical protein